MLTKTICKTMLLLFIPFMAMTAGCLSPATIKPIASQNSDNISNYNANVAAAANALNREASFHGELEIQIVRNQVSGDLIQLPKKWLGSPTVPTSHDLSDPNEEPYISLAASAKTAREYRVKIAGVLESEEAVNAAVAAKFPLAADLAADTPGFSIIRVLDDAFALKDVNGQIINEVDADVRTEMIGKRNRLLDPYMSVQIQTHLVQTYLDALKDYLSLVIEQGQVAAGHANAISAYAQAKPQVSTLASALQDQELQSGVLELVKKRKGQAYAAHVEKYLEKTNNVLRVVDGLKK